jgi:hypothetical protein
MEHRSLDFLVAAPVTKERAFVMQLSGLLSRNFHIHIFSFPSDISLIYKVLV